MTKRETDMTNVRDFKDELVAIANAKLDDGLTSQDTREERQRDAKARNQPYPDRIDPSRNSPRLNDLSVEAILWIDYLDGKLSEQSQLRDEAETECERLKTLIQELHQKANNYTIVIH
jgi:phage shock protein A